jgi:hypothetical protein
MKHEEGFFKGVRRTDAPRSGHPPGRRIVIKERCFDMDTRKHHFSGADSE